MAVISKIPAKVSKVIKHTDNVCSYDLKPQKIVPRFKPGQFLHLSINHYDPSSQWPESRVFSIANSPTRKDYIKITFSVKGQYTKKMYHEINEGQIVWLKLPYGEFTFDTSDKDLIMIAGGTGITPFLSYLEYCIDKNINRKIKLYYGVKSKELILFDELFKDCEMHIPNFKKVIFIEQKCNHAFRKGVLNISQICNETANLTQTSFYISGPIEMVNSFKAVLLNKKILSSNIHIDNWE